ncbi:MAG: tyrosine-type recombinase/integrase [Candidatus Poribacteria bacterium]|nr:tyrosine-type recombinase/integrase [Candidatus Poribacteria bacterium]
MKGTRPLDNDEIRQVAASFTGTYQVRNRSLFMIGVSTGGRISELLGLRIGDVFQNRKPVTDLLYGKSIVKGGEVSRSVPVNADGRKAIDELVNWHRQHYRSIAAKRPLFPSRHQSGTVPLHRQTAHEILKTAFIEAGLNGHIATHSLRKSFAQRLYDKTGDIYLVQELLGHRNISTTQKYLGVNYADAKAAVEAIALITESDRRPLLYNSLSEIDDETLRSELEKRGYNVTYQREIETTAEIVKIR